MMAALALLMVASATSGGVAQPVEHRAPTAYVAGSTPATSAIVQGSSAVERLALNQDVEGSSPSPATSYTEPLVYTEPELPAVAPPAPIPAVKPQPAPQPSVEAASAPSGAPWFVPAAWAERYMACMADPPYDVSAMVWAGSREAGVERGWRYADAMFVVSKEGGGNPCQFNTQGSGACGPFQLLVCPADGLTFDGQLYGALAKFRDGGLDSFATHWFAFWVAPE